MKAALVIMAAGMGSRYGGNKQVDGVGPNGEILMEYSIYDAIRAGFTKVVFIIKPEMVDMMKNLCGDRVAQRKTRDGENVEVCYAFQDFSSVPDFYTIPADRVKPFGTTHAVLCARGVIDEPFCVINADDYYGVDAFRIVYEELGRLAATGEATMVGYLLKNTVTENGSVARGVCELDAAGNLVAVVENTQIETYPGGIHTTFDGGRTWKDLAPDTLVSMNLWCYRPSFVAELKRQFPEFLNRELKANPIKCEFFLPLTVTEMLRAGKADVKVLSSTDKWYGVTYKEDRPGVVAALAQKVDEGLYPTPIA